MDEVNSVMTPLMQYGFAGMSAILLAILVWIIRQLLDLIRSNNEALRDVTSAIQAMTTMASDNVKLQRDIHDRLLQRPCIAVFKVASGSNINN